MPGSSSDNLKQQIESRAVDLMLEGHGKLEEQEMQEILSDVGSDHGAGGDRRDWGAS